jgi:hypothetical protein
MQTLTAQTWQDLQEFFFAESWNSALGRYRSNFAFRGMARAGDSLATSFLRTYGNQPHIETALLRNLRKYARVDERADFNSWDWLSLAQHHGLPTRLLDWTYSPFVALHFVTADTEEADTDGVVWCINFVEAHKRLPGLLRRELDRESSNVFTTEMLTRRVPDLQALDRLAHRPHSKAQNPKTRIRKTSPLDRFLLFFEPPSLDSRIVNQFALFSVQPDTDATIEEWVAAHPKLCRRIIVKASLKWEARDRLDQANITERVLFPGLDGLCAWLKRYYMPNPHGESPNTTQP